MTIKLPQVLLLLLSLSHTTTTSTATTTTATTTTTTSTAFCFNHPVTIVVPCYNEEHRLPRAAFLHYVQQQQQQQQQQSSSCSHPTQFLFVNDGSTDGTLQVLHDLHAAHPTALQVLDLQPNRGKAEAVRQGLMHVLLSTVQNGNNLISPMAQKDAPVIVGYWDGDLATPLESINVFLQIFEQKPQIDMVFGSRVALLGRNIQRHASRHYLGRIFATLASSLLGLRIYDTQCGAKLFRVTEDLRLALTEPFENRWIFDVEFIARLQTQRTRTRSQAILQQAAPLPLERTIYESPLDEWRDISGSKLSFKHKTSALYGLFHIWRRYTSKWQDWNPIPPIHSDHSTSTVSGANNSSRSFFFIFIGMLMTFGVFFLWCMYVGIRFCCRRTASGTGSITLKED